MSNSLQPYGLLGSSVHGISQARTLKRVATPPGDLLRSLLSPALAGKFFNTGKNRLDGSKTQQDNIKDQKKRGEEKHYGMVLGLSGFPVTSPTSLKQVG